MEQQSDHDLLAGGLDEVMAENRAAASRARRLVTFFRRHERGDDDDPRTLSARDRVTAEVSELWAIPASWVRRQLHDALWVETYFPYLRDLAAAGRIDPFRSGLIAETARHALDTDEEYLALARRLEPYLRRHLRPDGVVACSHKQLRNKLAYEVRVLRSADAEARYLDAVAHRDVRVGAGEDGVSWLTVAGTTDRVLLADQRLTLGARAIKAAGDDRTVDQIRADLALDLLTGVATDTTGVLPRFARPVVNLTVPVQTVMGIADLPGTLSGGQVVPASLARVIAQRPGATWHRLLTDPAGRCVELSTDTYAPTPAIGEQVVGTHPTCFRPGCDRPSTTCDLDHRVRWPLGPTSVSNLWPACRADHRVKHAAGFAVVQTRDGGFALRTAAGFSHPVPDAEHPASDDWTAVPEEIQLSATEITTALSRAHAERERTAPPRPDLLWEHDLWFGLRYGEAA